jgi:signal transduction histidine kinase/DNA-binding response OmpR family regulator
MKERTEVTEARNRMVVDIFLVLYLVKSAAVVSFCFFPFSCVFAQSAHSAVIELDSALIAQLQTDPLRPRQSVYFLAEPPVGKKLPPLIHEHAYELVNTFPRQTARIDRYWLYFNIRNDPAHRLRKYLTLLAYLFTADLCLALIQVAVWGFDSLSYEHHEHPVLAFVSMFRATFFWTAMVFIFGVLMYYLLLKDRFLRLLAGSSLFFAVGGLVFALLDYDIYLFSDAGNNYYFFQITSIFQLLTFALLLSYRTRKTEWEKIELETIDAAKSRFFANVSHEFRTPLTLILGPVSDLLKNKFSPKEHQLLGLIQKNGRRLMRLVNQILDLAKLDSGAMEWNARPGEFVCFTQKITQSFSSFAENRNVRLSFEAHPGELWTVFDADHFEKIIYNLLSNAIKYTPEGGQVSLLLHGDYTRKQVVLRVQDTGIGISEEWLPRIFDRFYQGDSADYTTDLPSTGIGLALTKELVELHGGRITMQSTLRQGSTFTVTFPLQEVEPVQASTPDDPIALAGETAQVFAPDWEQPDDHDSKPQVLVIEDNEDMLAYIQGRLSNKFDILPARDGKEGVEKAMAQVPDLIVTDIMMPKKDGFTVTQELKEHFTTSHIPIIILTGKSTKESRLYGLEIDADEYLTKPFEAAELEVRIRNLLRNRRRLQAYYSKNFLTRPGDQKATSREEVFLQKVTGLIAENLGNEAFTVEALGQALFIDRTQLYRKLHALTGKSPSRFIRSYRLLRAREFLHADSGTVAEIAFEVGFSSTSYFNRAFKEEFGMTPSQFRASL